ncbi:MAG: carbamoyltransferase HypF [Methanospirillum sp.]|nr:carbamoyltransferase HypF [Methanospirillum sp.]
MRQGLITVRGVVQGVGFRPFVYAHAVRLGVRGTVQNLGSQVEVRAAGDRFAELVDALRAGPPLSRIDEVVVRSLDGPVPDGFSILPSAEGARTGLIPPDVAICGRCLAEIDSPSSRYGGYWATSCVDCGPRYSIIRDMPYDRPLTSMDAFPLCDGCRAEFVDPGSRRHHAQTIACPDCGPRLALMNAAGRPVHCSDPVGEAAALLDSGLIVAIRGLGGFHISSVEEAAGRLKERLGRPEQPLAVMARPGWIEAETRLSERDRAILGSVERPILVLEKRDPESHAGISNLHTIGVMLPYSGLHHLLFAALAHPVLVMTSANVPGYPMVTGLDRALVALGGVADYFLSHDREIVNRCDDSVVRDGYLIRLSRGHAPLRTPVDLGDRCILGVGPELSANATIYRDGHAVTSPHVGNVRNPETLAYLVETIGKLENWLGARYDLVAHDLHPQFLSTRYARELAEGLGIPAVPVQHHEAHIASVTCEPCVGIAIDGVGYGRDGTVWGGEIFAGSVPALDRAGNLEPVPMPGGDLATRFPERMLYGILPGDRVLELLGTRGWTDLERDVLARQTARRVNAPLTSSTGRALDAAAALLGLCRERTYDGEPAMKLEAAAAGGRAEAWESSLRNGGTTAVIETRVLMGELMDRFLAIDRPGSPAGRRAVADLAASFQANLARDIALAAARVAGERDLSRVALSGGVAINAAIRETITATLEARGLAVLVNDRYPLGDGCISYGQCVMASTLPG